MPANVGFSNGRKTIKSWMFTFFKTPPSLMTSILVVTLGFNSVNVNRKCCWFVYGEQRYLLRQTKRRCSIIRSLSLLVSEVIGLSVLTGTGARQTDGQTGVVHPLREMFYKRRERKGDKTSEITSEVFPRRYPRPPNWKPFQTDPVDLLALFFLFNRCLWRFVRFNRHRFLWRDLSLFELVLSGFIQTVSGFRNQEL